MVGLNEFARIIEEPLIIKFQPFTNSWICFFENSEITQDPCLESWGVGPTVKEAVEDFINLFAGKSLVCDKTRTYKIPETLTVDEIFSQDVVKILDVCKKWADKRGICIETSDLQRPIHKVLDDMFSVYHNAALECMDG